MNVSGLDFERPIVELERKIEDLRRFAAEKKIDLSGEISKLEDKLNNVKKEIFGKLTPWQKVQIARHPQRPYTLDYINLIMTDFLELHGDRYFGDDKAIISGFAKLNGNKVCVIGHQKGRDTKENLLRNFGSAHPEGYRKALRLMKLSEKFKVPVICLVDTPGAYPGVGAEERGQAEAIAENLFEMSKLKTPTLVYIIGEGGSGGALGIGVGDHTAILENAYYSVISPEGCAAILWKNRTKAPDAAAVLKLTGEDLLKMGIVDEIVPEPLGGAHRDQEKTAKNLKESLEKNLSALSGVSVDELLKKRYDHFRKMGVTTNVS
ncbi:MAG: acetyl-CoA carboxylase carboxyltransferase subunit alpha [Candidatus Omnitrophota bacterium]